MAPATTRAPIPAAAVALALLTVVSAQARICSKTHPFVGFRGRFEGLPSRQHRFDGIVTILDDCRYRIEQYDYDNTAPAAYFWGSASVSFRDLKKGFRLQQSLLPAGNGRRTLTLELPVDVTWDEVKAISGWCERFDAVFGGVALAPGPTTTSTSTSTSTTTTSTTTSTSTTVSTTIAPTTTQSTRAATTTASHSTAGPTDATSEFPSNPTTVPPETTTTAADVTTTAVTTPTPTTTTKPITTATTTSTATTTDAGPPEPEDDLSFANCKTLDFDKLNLYWQVDGDEIRFALEGYGEEHTWMSFGVPESETNPRMIGSDVTVAGILNDGQGFTHDYYLQTKNQCSYTASKPEGVCPDTLLPQGQDQVRLVTHERKGNVNFVAYHTSSQRSMPDFKLDLSKETYDCNVPMGLVSNPAPTGCAPAVLEGESQFVVTTGANLNYPNPPAWGLSYHINGKESPVIQVIRGREYTFTIQASTDHPFYITSDIIGGRSKPSEVVFAGDETTFGDASRPYVLKWTPDNDTPDTVFYQCWIHQKLGWKIEVSGSFDGKGGSTGAAGCGKTHPKVGFKGAMSQREHDWEGVLEVVDDCTFRVTNFRYDGGGPAAYWFAGEDDSQASFTEGFRVNDFEIAGAPKGGETVEVKLKEGVTWDDIGAISGWCEDFNANFGSVAITASQGCAPSSESGFSCMIPGPIGTTLHWSVNNDESLLVGVRFPGVATGWVAVAFATAAGQMSPGDAVIGWVNSDGGSKVLPYKLVGREAVSDTTRSLRDATITSGPDGMFLQFLRNMDDGGDAVLDYDAATNLNFAYLSGTDVVNDAPGQHEARGSLSLSFAAPDASGSSALADQEAAALRRERLMVAHGSLMALAWVVFLPLGAACARQLKMASASARPRWFKAHIVLQVTGLAVSLAGWAIALANFGTVTDTLYHHGELGTAVMALALFQPLNALLRPHPGPSSTRKLWEALHWLVGKSAILLASVNIVLGILILTASPKFAFGSWFGGWAAALVAVVLLNDYLQRRTLAGANPRPATVSSGPLKAYDVGLHLDEGMFVAQPTSSSRASVHV